MIKNRILKHLLFLGLALIFSIAMAPQLSLAQLDPGPFEVGDLVVSDIAISDDVEFLEGLFVCIGTDDEPYLKPENNRAIIYFPATEGGAVVSDRFPLIVFGHGMRAKCSACPENSPDDNEEDFRRWSVILRHLASWGFIIISPDLSWLTPQVGTIGIEDRMFLLRDAVNYMLDENSRTGSLFANRVRSTCIGAMGHSMGADAAILLGTSGELGENIRVIAPIAPPNALGSAHIRDFAPRPVILFQGTKDIWHCLFSPPTAEAIYAAYDTAERTKHLVTIEGANHFGYSDDICDNSDDLPDDVCPPGDLLLWDDQQSIAKAYLTAFFRRYLSPGCVAELDVYLNGSQEFEGLESFDVEVVEEVTSGTDCSCRGVRLLQLDIKPGSCPNPLNIDLFGFAAGSNPQKNGVLPVAVLGSDDFDVNEIDVSTLRFEGVEPLMLGGGPIFEDVATAFDKDSECACTDAGPDGFIDLKMKFLSQEIAAAIPMGTRGEERVLTLTGELLDGTPFEATDCVVFVGPRDDGMMPANERPTMTTAFPNPFNPATLISYSIPERRHVSLAVYDVAGRLVEELVNEVQGVGEHIVEWNAGDRPSGIYFYTLTAGSTTITKKIVLLK